MSFQPVAYVCVELGDDPEFRHVAYEDGVVELTFDRAGRGGYELGLLTTEGGLARLAEQCADALAATRAAGHSET